MPQRVMGSEFATAVGAAVAAGFVGFAGSCALGQEIPFVVARSGVAVPGSDGLLVLAINDPTINGLDQVAFTGLLNNGASDSIGFIWFNDGIVWLNTDALPIQLAGAEGTMGVGDQGEWVYSPLQGINGDAIWQNGVKVLRTNDPAPGLPGYFATFSSRPQMDAAGMATWVSGISDAPGGLTMGRVLYRASVPLIKSGDVIGGYTINTQGVGFPYDFSANGVHSIVRCRGDQPGAFDVPFLVRDGAIVAVAGQVPGGAVAAYQTFDECAINNLGDWVASGDTDDNTIVDGFIVFNGGLVAEEGDTIAPGLVLSGNPRAISVDDHGRVGAIWSTASGSELFMLFAPPQFDGPLSMGTAWDAVVLLSTGDFIDTDGDGLPDSQVTDFNATSSVGPGLRLPNRCHAYVSVDVEDGLAPDYAAIVAVLLPEARYPSDINNDGFVDGIDLGMLLNDWGAPGLADLNCDGIVNQEDLGLLEADWGPDPDPGGGND